jgi:hypothetical protein
VLQCGASTDSKPSDKCYIELCTRQPNFQRVPQRKALKRILTVVAPRVSGNDDAMFPIRLKR